MEGEGEKDAKHRQGGSRLPGEHGMIMTKNMGTPMGARVVTRQERKKTKDWNDPCPRSRSTKQCEEGEMEGKRGVQTLLGSHLCTWNQSRKLNKKTRPPGKRVKERGHLKDWGQVWEGKDGPERGGPKGLGRVG